MDAFYRAVDLCIIFGIIVALLLPLAFSKLMLNHFNNSIIAMLFIGITGFLMIWAYIYVTPYAFTALNERAIAVFLGREKAMNYIIENNKPKPTRIPIRTDIARYKLVGMNPPKHFYVTLERNGIVSQHYVSKHCNRYKDNTIGDEYNLEVEVYRMSNSPKELIQFNNLYHAFCS